MKIRHKNLTHPDLIKLFSSSRELYEEILALEWVNFLLFKDISPEMALDHCKIPLDYFSGKVIQRWHWIIVKFLLITFREK